MLSSYGQLRDNYCTRVLEDLRVSRTRSVAFAVLFEVTICTCKTVRLSFISCCFESDGLHPCWSF